MNKKYIKSMICAVLFVLLMVVLKTIDVANVGAKSTAIGLSSLNVLFHEITGVNWTIYKVTGIVGYAAIASCLVFVFEGAYQLFTRKSLLKVDDEILLTGILYAVMAFFYVLFEKVIINYRPIIMPGETLPEASFPSSHTLLSIVLMVSAYLLIDIYVTNKKTQKILKIIAMVMMVIVAVGRLICGVHWLTDIIGGVLLACAILYSYSALLDRTK